MSEHPCEEFFIRKIKEGLAIHSEVLAPEEEKLLRTHVSVLSETPSFSPEKAQTLQQKCTGALNESYARDTTRGNREAAVEWRTNNEKLYKHSQCVVSGIVQNWYLADDMYSSQV